MLMCGLKDVLHSANVQFVIHFPLSQYITKTTKDKIITLHTKKKLTIIVIYIKYSHIHFK